MGKYEREYGKTRESEQLISMIPSRVEPRIDISYSNNTRVQDIINKFNKNCTGCNKIINTIKINNSTFCAYCKSWYCNDCLTNHKKL